MIFFSLFQYQLVLDIPLLDVHKATGNCSFIKVAFEQTDGLLFVEYKKGKKVNIQCKCPVRIKCGLHKLKLKTMTTFHKFKAW